MGTFPVFKYGGKGVDVTLRTEYDPPGVYWSKGYNSYVLVADPERGPWNYKGKRVSLLSINGFGEIRWDIGVPIRPGAWSGDNDSEATIKFFGLTPWVSSRDNRRNRMVRRNSEGQIVISGAEGIAAYRMLALKGMLKLETLGMKHSRGSAYAAIKRDFGLKGSKQSVLAQFTKMCEEVVAHRAKPPGFNPGKKSGKNPYAVAYVTPGKFGQEHEVRAFDMLYSDERRAHEEARRHGGRTGVAYIPNSAKNPLTRREQRNPKGRRGVIVKYGAIYRPVGKKDWVGLGYYPTLRGARQALDRGLPKFGYDLQVIEEYGFGGQRKSSVVFSYIGNPLTRREQGKVLKLAVQAGKRYEKYDERNIEDDFYSGSALGKQTAYKHVARRFGPRKRVRRNPGRKVKVTWMLGEAAHKFLSHLDHRHLSIWREVTPEDIMRGTQRATTARKASAGTVHDRFLQFSEKLGNMSLMILPQYGNAPLRVIAGAWGMMEQMRSDF